MVAIGRHLHLQSVWGQAQITAYFELAEADEFERAVPDPRDKALIRLLFGLGCLVSAVQALCLQDTDIAVGAFAILHIEPPRTKLLRLFTHTGEL